MSETLNFNTMRQTEARNTVAEQGHHANEQRREGAVRTAECRKCGLDTGARGWRYAYQTH